MRAWGEWAYNFLVAEVDISRRCIVDTVLKHHPDLEADVLELLSLGVLLAMIPPIEVIPSQFFADDKPLVADDYRLFPHRRNASSTHLSGK